jgi:hypothetical protein
MSRIDQFAHQLISDTLIDELADLLYEAAIRSDTPHKEIRRIVGDFLKDYIDADKVLCSVCMETKTFYVNQQWQKTWQEVVRRVQQKMTEPLSDNTELIL